MDNNFIKDKREFPEEMSTSKKQRTSKATNATKEHPGHVLLWIVGLLLLLALVFFVGLWAGKRTSRVINNESNDARQAEIQRAIEEQVQYNDVYVVPEDRSERLRNFFSE